jgi:acetate kinase
MSGSEMNIVTVNAGSSSLRLSAFRYDDVKLESFAHRRYDSGDVEQEDLLGNFFQGINPSAISAVVHRVVHGGIKFIKPCLISEEVEREIDILSPLAPLHNPAAMTWIRKARALMGENIPQFAVFDTAFFYTLPIVAQTYALPKSLVNQYGIRRFGFHGIAHQAMWRRWCEIRPELNAGGRLITLQLGAGSSITAIYQGTPKDTSMGFSPLEGLVMATRCGDTDPGIFTYLLREGKYSPGQLDGILNNASGLLGVSDLSADMSMLLQSEEPDARLAIELYCYRIRKYIGAYLAVLGGADGILIGGGIGEHAPAIRQQIFEEMDSFGIVLDQDRNAGIRGQEGRISANGSAVDIRVTGVDEAMMLAQEAVWLLERNISHGGNMLFDDGTT